MDKTTNQIIHEWLNFCEHHPNISKCADCGGRLGDDNFHPPDYENDLNAVREAELKAIEEFGEPKYWEALRVYVPGYPVATTMGLIVAEPQYRAKAIRKLVEENNGYWPSTEVDSQDTH